MEPFLYNLKISKNTNHKKRSYNMVKNFHTGMYIRSKSLHRDWYIVFYQIHLKFSENWFRHFSPKTQWFTEFSVKILSIFAIFAVFPQNLERILRKWNIFIIFMPGCRFLINYSYLAIHLLLQIWGGKNCIHWVFSESLSF